MKGVLLMKLKYSFDEYEPFWNFIEANENHIVGQEICGFYGSSCWGGFLDSSLVIELERFSLILRYFRYSDIDIYIVDKKIGQQDINLNSLWEDFPGVSIYDEWVYPMESPYIGSVIRKIKVNHFSHEFEINPSTRETRPEGGDYFSKITVMLEDGKEFYICAASPMCDGGMEIWG